MTLLLMSACSVTSLSLKSLLPCSMLCPRQESALLRAQPYPMQQI